jgi:hypothetical protein
VFISNRPLSSVLAALTVAAAFVIADKLYHQHSETVAEAAETSMAVTPVVASRR